MSFAAAECINWCAGSAHGLGILEKVLGHFVIRIKGTGRMAFTQGQSVRKSPSRERGNPV
jgi:hypothetical protein